jgi:hypothetical protein
MLEEERVILRIDVDYPYPSRIKSFLFAGLGIKTGKDYLRNSKIISRMINESTKSVKAFWFFTPKTIPDAELLNLLSGDKHEISLHVVNDPVQELEKLEKVTGRKIRFYTIHGTARLLARIMWKRWNRKVPHMPEGFPLQSFHQFPTSGLDSLCYLYSRVEAEKIVEEAVKYGKVIEIHPIWLFQKGKINRRGQYYETFRRLLEVDSDQETIVVQKKLFFKMAKDINEYVKDVIPTGNFTVKLRERGVDVFTFIERNWCSTIQSTSESWVSEEDNIGLLAVISYEKWLRSVVKKTRHNMVRKAERSGIRTEIVEADEKFFKDVWRIYNETPIRQNRAFPHYGITLKTLKQNMLLSENCTYVGAYLQDELVGFSQIIHGNNVAILSQLLSLQKHWDKAVNNALIAKAVQICEIEGSSGLCMEEWKQHIHR